MEELRTRAAAHGIPAVLLTHVTVSGATVHAHRISQRDDVVIPRGSFPEFELTVIGHIHKAEQIGGGHFYYVGALDRMDVAEKDYEPRVLLADVGPQGVRNITSLPLDPTPIAAVEACTDEDLEAAAAAMPRVAETLVKLTLRVAEGTYTAPLLERAKELFPRLYGNVDHAWTDASTDAKTAVEGLNPADVMATVAWYLGEQEMPEGERVALLALVEDLRRAPTEAPA
jgi:DNA repair exonuclease SbcCD nuclease subunit